MVKIVDGGTPLLDIEVPCLGMSLKAMQEIINAKIGQFSFMKVIGNSKVPVNYSFVETKSVKDLLSETSTLARTLFIKRG